MKVYGFYINCSTSHCFFQLTGAPNKQRLGGDRRQLCPLQRAAGTPELALLRAPRGRGTPTPQPRLSLPTLDTQSGKSHFGRALDFSTQPHIEGPARRTLRARARGRRAPTASGQHRKFVELDKGLVCVRVCARASMYMCVGVGVWAPAAWRGREAFPGLPSGSALPRAPPGG